MFIASVRVMFKTMVNDPQGATIARALGRLGFDEVASVRTGKVFEIQLKESNPDRADLLVQDMCSKLLANTLIEQYEYSLRAVDDYPENNLG